MPLNLGEKGEGSLFGHNRDYEEGVNQRGIRPGQATVVLALDGSGDSEDLQEAIKMLPSSGGEIFVKEGNYILSAQVNVNKDNVNISGTGDGTVFSGSFNTDPLFNVSEDNITIQNIKMTHTGVTNNPACIAAISTASNIKINNCRLTAKGPAIEITSSSEIFINQCDCLSNGGDRAISIDGGSDITITDCILQGTSGNGRGIGITEDIGSNSRVIIKGCKINNSATHGIEILGSSGVIITGNTIKSNGGRGIVMSDGNVDNTIITSNNIQSNGSYGVDIFEASVSRTLVGNNHVRQNTTGQINDSGTSSLVADNIIA